MTMDVPLTHEDLERIAASLKEWGDLLTNGRGGYKEVADCVSRIEVTRPDTDDEVIGFFTLYDGGVGFEPKGARHE